MTPSLARVPVEPAWFGAIAHRHSRRRFDGRPLEQSVLERLTSLAARLGVSDRGGRVAIVRAAPADLFTGFIGSYGAVKGAPSAAVFVGPQGSGVDLGYLGEALILEATLADVNTCWIAGSFDRQRSSTLVDLAPGESVRACTPLGHALAEPQLIERAMATFTSHRRVDLETVAPGVARWPGWAREAAEAVRVGPSGGNAQSWRLRFEDDALIVGVKEKPYGSWELDCGIAMLHAELGAAQAGVSGDWERLGGGDVAAFRAHRTQKSDRAFESTKSAGDV